MTTDTLVAAAAALRSIIEELPPASPNDRATARRMEGAAAALEVLAGVPKTID